MTASLLTLAITIQTNKQKMKNHNYFKRIATSKNNTDSTVKIIKTKKRRRKIRKRKRRKRKMMRKKIHVIAPSLSLSL